MSRKIPAKTKYVIPFVGCALLILGIGFGLRYSTEPPADVPQSQALRKLVTRYTTHPTSVAPGEIVTVRISEAFSSSDRAKIVLAVSEWNYALNGRVRFQIASVSTVQSSPMWRIEALPGGKSVGQGYNGEMLAATYTISRSSGIIMVFPDHVGTRDLRGVALHELGHALGLQHDPRGHLMSTHYSESNEQCIDKAAIDGVAAGRHLAVGDLNWCEVSVASTR